MQSGCEVLDKWDGIPVGYCSIIKCTIVPTIMPVPSSLFGTIWRGEAQLLNDGLMIPSSNMFWNSCMAIFSHSGAKCRGLAHTGGPFIPIWWVMSCNIWTFLLYGLAIAGKSIKIFWQSDLGCLGNKERARADVTEDAMPCTFKCMGPKGGVISYQLKDRNASENQHLRLLWKYPWL